MKKRYITIVLLVAFLSGSFSFSQITKAEAIYKVKIQRKENTPRTKYSKNIDLLFKEMDNINLLLLYNNGKAVFKKEEILDVDNRTERLHRMASMVAEVTSSYYSNVKEKTNIEDLEMNGTIYNIVYKFNHYEWELVNKTKTIGKYLCYKATTTYSYKNRKGTVTNLDVIAWYTPQIPIPLGPKNYTGLPGLILELQEGPRTIYVTELTLNPKKNIKIDSVPDGKEVTKKEFEKITSKAYGNFMDSMKNE